MDLVFHLGPLVYGEGSIRPSMGVEEGHQYMIIFREMVILYIRKQSFLACKNLSDIFLLHTDTATDDDRHVISVSIL